MKFNTNSPFLYIVGAIVILFVLAQSLFFLVRAYRRGKQLGISTAKLRKTIVSTSVFTIAPAISFLLGIVTLSKFLGIPLPWIRMSVIGAITYELPAATAAAGSFGITELSEMITDPKVYAAIAWVMTLGILPSIILPPILMKKIRGGVVKLQNKDQKWGDMFMASLFLGMISAFLGMVFADIRSGLEGWIPVFVLLVSAALMGVCGLLIKKCGWKWLETYAMTVSMLGAMVFAALITPVIVK
ncbi:MAG: DUF5058 family protein [Ruminococcaceae bacterium]|nr:DUF5058 family protein [Oscillospiraceae bacterium]